MPDSQHKGQEGLQLTREASVSSGEGWEGAPASKALRSSLYSLRKKRASIYPKILHVIDL